MNRREFLSTGAIGAVALGAGAMPALAQSKVALKASDVHPAGYPTVVAVENIGAGYHTLAEAFSGWRDSPPHNANMLKGGVTHMGIATAYAPNSKYKVFWTLILAGVDESGGKGLPVMGAPEPKSKAKVKKKQ